MHRGILLAAMAITGATMTTPAIAQVNASNLVSVNISNVANNLAKNLSVDVQDVIDIGSVQVPIGVAANVCNVSAAVLAQGAKNGTATCDATTSNQALTKVVQRQLNAQ